MRASYSGAGCFNEIAYQQPSLYGFTY